MLDCALIKEFKILPDSVNKNLNDLYFTQKKILAQIAGSALDTDNLKKLLAYQAFIKEIDNIEDEKLFHPVILDGIKKTILDKKELKSEIKKKADIIRDVRKREAYLHYFPNKEG